MRLRPLNNVLIVKQDPIVRHEGIIAVPEKNTVEKISPYATVISCGPSCKYPFKTGQRIIIHTFRDRPMWIEVEKERYRIINEDYVSAVEEP